MEYSKTYRAKDEHIDIQEIMEGLYYPFYMEDCRHVFIRDVLGFDFKRRQKRSLYDTVKLQYYISPFTEKR